jgi:hypothetical protein
MMHEPISSASYTEDQRAELTLRAHDLLQSKKAPRFVEIDLGKSPGEKPLHELRLFMVRLLSIGVDFVGTESVKDEATWREALSRDFVTTYGADARTADACVTWIIDTLRAENAEFKPWNANRERRTNVTRLAHQMQRVGVESESHVSGPLHDAAESLARLDVSTTPSRQATYVFQVPTLADASEASQEVLNAWTEAVEQSIRLRWMDAGKQPMKVFSHVSTPARVEKQLRALPGHDVAAVTAVIKKWTAKTLTDIQKL